jgi:sigma-54 dependent transcriptional regulator, acetoin dehydrogenase operon transcriptional activator AcoR
VPGTYRDAMAGLDVNARDARFSMRDPLFDVTKPEGLAAISAVRERFLDDPETDLTGIRPQIARSWRRCAAMSVDPEAMFQVDPAARIDEQTLGCAAPFVRELEQMALDAGGGVTLMSSGGALVGDLTPAIQDRFPHGRVLLESACGTNGDGTALEEGRSGWVYSSEHYREDMLPDSCFSVLIRDPFRDNVRACLTLTLPEPVMLASDPRGVALIVEGVAAKITRELAARSATREQLLFAEYLRVNRRYRHGALIATDGKHTMVSDPALELLRQDDFVVISSYAQEALRVRRAVRHEVTLSGDRPVQLQISMAGPAADPLGAIVLVKPVAGRGNHHVESCAPAVITRPSDSAPRLFDDLVGENRAFHQALEVATSAAARRRSVHILGDRGTGKHTIAVRIAGAWSSDVETLDCERMQENVPVFVEAVRARLQAGGAVVLREADALTAAASARLSELVRQFDQPAVVMTMRRPTTQAVALTAALHTVEVALPALRSRREDIPALALRFIADITDKRPSARLLYVLGQADWPANVQTLRDVVEQAAMKAAGAEVSVDDLPHSFRGGALGQGTLSRLEEVELHELRAALEEARGNRTLAADILQIGRSTLYRRLDSYRRRGFVI